MPFGTIKRALSRSRPRSRRRPGCRSRATRIRHATKGLDSHQELEKLRDELRYAQEALKALRDIRAYEAKTELEERLASEELAASKASGGLMVMSYPDHLL